MRGNRIYREQVWCGHRPNSAQSARLGGNRPWQRAQPEARLSMQTFVDNIRLWLFPAITSAWPLLRVSVSFHCKLCEVLRPYYIFIRVHFFLSASKCGNALMHRSNDTLVEMFKLFIVKCTRSSFSSYDRMHNELRALNNWKDTICGSMLLLQWWWWYS